MGVSIERSRFRFPADLGVRKGIRPQMLLCHTSTQVRRPVLILEIKNQVTSTFLTEYHRVSRLNEREFLLGNEWERSFFSTYERCQVNKEPVD